MAQLSAAGMTAEVKLNLPITGASVVAKKSAAMTQQMQKSRAELAANLLTSAGTGIVSISATNPVNTLKIRWQVLATMFGDSGATSLPKFAREVVVGDGLWTGLWSPGLAPGLIGSVASVGLRYGTYPLFRDGVGSFERALLGEREKTSAGGMFVAGLTSGMMGYFVASPFLMVMTQMQAEAGKIGPQGVYVTGSRVGLPPSYRNFVHALQSIAARGAGISGFALAGSLRALWKGSSVVTLRGGVLNASQMMGYDKTKTELKAQQLLPDGPLLHITASLVAALCATTCSMPLDVLLTTYQSAQNMGGEHYNKYGRGPMSCARSLHQEFGPGIFMRGWVPNFCRLTPICVGSMYVYEQLRRFAGIGYLD